MLVIGMTWCNRANLCGVRLSIGDVDFMHSANRHQVTSFIFASVCGYDGIAVRIYSDYSVAHMDIPVLALPCDRMSLHGLLLAPTHGIVC